MYHGPGIVTVLDLVKTKPLDIPEVLLNYNLPIPYMGAYRFVLHRRVGTRTATNSAPAFFSINNQKDTNEETEADVDSTDRLLIDYRASYAIAEKIVSGLNTPHLLLAPGFLLRIMTGSTTYTSPTICIHRHPRMRIRRENHIWASQNVENTIRNLCRKIITAVSEERQKTMKMKEGENYRAIIPHAKKMDDGRSTKNLHLLFSSGVGGLRNIDVVSSDGGGSSSTGLSEPPAVYYPLPAPELERPMSMYPVPHQACPQPPPLQNSLGHQGMAKMAMYATTPSAAINEIFIHIEAGESLNVYVGSDQQQIVGPATVRMVNDGQILPSALPLHVPPGHQIHQICDENGIVRHLILSTETSTPLRYANVLNVFPRVSGQQSAPQMVAIPPIQSNFYTMDSRTRWNQATSVPDGTPPFIQRESEPAPDLTDMLPINTVNNSDVISNVKRPSVSRVRSPASATSNGDEQETPDFDIEDWEKVDEMLTRIQAPTICKVTSTSVEITWQELDTSEAAAPGGPFPQIDPSEFTYQLMVFQNDQTPPRFICSYRCKTQCKMRIEELKPFTDYYVQLKASLEERGLHGEPSSPVHFKTAQGIPEPVDSIRLVEKGPDFCILTWTTPECNGSPLECFQLFMRRDDEEFKKICEGLEEKATITGLLPNTTYFFAMITKSRIGESAMCEVLKVVTSHEAPPVAPPLPSIVSVSPKAVKLAWTGKPDHTYTLEMNDVQNDSIIFVKERATCSSATVNNVTPGTEVRFRLTAHTVGGDSPKTEWVNVKVPCGKQEKENQRERILIPQKPFFNPTNKGRKMEIGWKVPGARDREFSFHVQGAAEPSSATSAPKWRTIYKGTAQSVLITEDNLALFRVQTINKKQSPSEWSEVLILPRNDELLKPGPLQAPELLVLSKDTIQVAWKNLEDFKAPPRMSYRFEVRRQIGNESSSVYIGDELKCTIDGLLPRQKVTVQVRLVLHDSDDHQIDGQWSAASTATTLPAPPKPPKNVHVDQDRNVLEWEEAETGCRFRVIRSKVLPDGKLLKQEEKETLHERISLGELDYATHYQYTVVAFHEGGESETSAPVDCITSAAQPQQPNTVLVESTGPTDVVLKWNPPNNCGSEINQYHIRVMKDDELIRDISFLPPNCNQCEHKITDLEPSTDYKFYFCAENEIGRSSPAIISGRTRSPPPEPPFLECDAEPTMLRLRWKNKQSTTTLKYKVVRILENNSQQFIYEGEGSSCKVRSLIETTEYNFQIRASDKNSGAGPWSKVYSFRTAVCIPPQIRGGLSVSRPNNTSEFIGIEWSPCISQTFNSRNMFYRVELLDAGETNAEWKTVYEGVDPRFPLKLSDFAGSIQLRARCIRPDVHGLVERYLSSPYTPILNIQNEGKAKEEEKTTEKVPKQRQSRVPSAIRNFRANFPNVVLILAVSFAFALLSVSVVQIIKWYAVDNSVAVPPTVTPQPRPNRNPSAPPLPSPQGASIGGLPRPSSVNIPPRKHGH